MTRSPSPSETSHGRYPVPKQLDLELLQRIRDALDINISLHGGSGTPGHYFQNAAQIGAHPDEYAIVKLIDPVISAVQTVVEQHIDLFGSTGRAEP